jgi:hypothetical protein
MVNSIGPAFQGIGEIAKKMWADLKTWVNDTFIQPVKDKLEDLKIWWAGFKEDVQLKWDILTGYIGEKLSAFWDWLPDLPNIFSLSFWTGLFTSISTTVRGWMSGIWDALPDMPDFFSLKFWTGLVSDIGSAFGTIGDFIVDGLKASINVMIGLINDLLGSINFNKTLTNPITGTEYNFGMDLSNWKIPMLAKGGIVNSPTLAMIGEAGPEAVVPLSGNNAGMGGTYNITVNAGGITDRTDKRALAREIGNMIQQELSRNTGGNTMRGRY